MDFALWVAVAVVVIASCGPITNGGTRRVNDKALARHVTKVGLALPPELRQPVISRITHRERLTAWGGVGGLVVGVALAIVLGRVGPPAPNGSDPAGFMIMMATAVGLSVGAVAAAAGPGAALNPGAPRMARGQETSLVDYLHRSELVALVIGMVLAPVTAVAALLLAPGMTGGQRILVVVAAGLATIAGAVVLLVLRHVARRPQRARSAIELAWDDVMRAGGLRQLLITGLVSGLAGTWVVVFTTALLHEAPVPATVVLLILGMLAAVAAFGVPLPFWAGRLHNYPLRRLWPTGVDGVASC